MSNAPLSTAQIQEVGVAEIKPATADQGREPIPRHIYVSMRLEEISTVIGIMAKERENLTADLKAPPGNAGANLKELRQRRSYLAQRLAILRKEQADLKGERRPGRT